MINHSFIIVSGLFIYYYGFMRHVHRRSQDDKKINLYYYIVHSINNILRKSC